MKRSVHLVLMLVLCLVLSLSGLHVGVPTTRAAETGTWTRLPLHATNVNSLAINPLTPTTLYAGTASGGVFRSTDSGDHWTAVNTGLSSPWVVSVGIDPLTPATLYAGTDGSVFRHEAKKQTVIVLKIGNSKFTVNGASTTLDSPPVIKNGRTLVPIRAIIEALGGTVGWDGTAKKATVALGSTTIELWIGKNAARVKGVSTPIDATNTKVVPEIINGRTMLPLRFVSENLGCSVVWAAATKTITITYQP